MEWIWKYPQIYSTFSNLGFVHGDRYHVNENCNAALETILHGILSEDKYLRSYRRSISFGQNVNQDLIPLWIHAKEDETIERLIRIFVNLTIPIECLLPVDVISRNDFGRHSIFEINNLLASTKVAFTDPRATRVVVQFLKKNVVCEHKSKLSLEQCTNISNSLLLLRNILHIPEESIDQSPSNNGPAHAVQNQILWNIFSQGIDKVLIKLIIIPEAKNWAVTMVQLIALLYKDQNVVTLHEFLNLWLEATPSESSDDNESNTSAPDRGSANSSPMLTSSPTSYSSDTGSEKSNNESNSDNKGWDTASMNISNENDNEAFTSPNENASETGEQEINNCVDVTNVDTKNFIQNEKETSCCSGEDSDRCDQVQSPSKTEIKTLISENSDCGYGTQIENHESVSISSNEDEFPGKKPIHQKPHNLKQRINNNARSAIITHERKRKKIIKRGKSNIINVQGLSHKMPTDDDITYVLKEFIIDFLLKGYNSLMETLHCQILTNLKLEIDTSHFFWLVTYFLKFAKQIELDLEHVSSVLTFDIVSYLIAEGVNLCEQFELAIKLDGNDLKPSSRRLHLVVTAIREIIQAIDEYKKIPHICKDDHDTLVNLQIKMCETEELRSLLVLLLQHYNPKHHTKQYLQDLIVTNHILLMFLDNTMKLPEYKGSTNMFDHIQQFATSEIMYNYGLMLEDYPCNGEFVNDCIFTLMHHVGGELGSLITLFQPKILKTFTCIWKSEFEICDDWSDLIEYVINTFIKKPHALHSLANFPLDTENFDEDKVASKLDVTSATQTKADAAKSAPVLKTMSCNSNSSSTSKDIWTDDELSLLSWNYMQYSTKVDVIGEIIKLLKEDDIIKSRDSVINQLFKQFVINKDEFEKLVKGESDRTTKNLLVIKEIRDDEIGKHCEQLVQDGQSIHLDWVQKVLLEICFAKINLEKKANNTSSDGILKSNDISPVVYHSFLFSQSVPLVPWNCKQAAICKNLKFLQLLHKLGFHMPVDSGKVFIRIPQFWAADCLYDIAGKISPIDTSKLKFAIDDITDSSIANSKQKASVILSADLTKDITMIETSEKSFQEDNRKQIPTMINYALKPGAAEVDKHNWLEVVQKSQEIKVILESRNINEEENAEWGVVMDPLSKEKEMSTVTAPRAGAAGPGLMMPPILSFKQHASEFIVKVSESDLCETASIASDQMYVSDEDEKPVVISRPVVVDATACIGNEQHGKRQRVQLFPTF